MDDHYLKLSVRILYSICNELYGISVLGDYNVGNGIIVETKIQKLGVAVKKVLYC